MVRHPNWGHPDRDACGTGFVTYLGRPASHEIVRLAQTALERLTHRGGVDADGASGDGAGLLVSLPQPFFRERAQQLGVSLAPTFGVGFCFFAPGTAQAAIAAVDYAATLERLRIAGWRRVPTEPECLGRQALKTMPEFWQLFVESFHPDRATGGFDRRLALLRKRIESVAPPGAYVASLSSRTITYKGLLTPEQFERFYPDLQDTTFAATFAVFHQRYSTNTQPSWHLAQPFRYVAHNGEINTIVSNRRWLRAKDAQIRASLDAGAWFGLLEDNVSDSASFDNALELRLLQGLGLDEALLALVPPTFENDPSYSRDVRGSLASLARLSEPWDGPAALVFSDGDFVGCKLDRNGLRPLRYTRTHDGLLVAGSETGLLDMEESRIAERQRLGPGEMILAHPEQGTFLRWRDLLKRMAAQQSRFSAPGLSLMTTSAAALAIRVEQPKRIAAASGWTDDQFKIVFSTLARGKEADWSMGDDAPLAFLSALRRPLWDYCKQRFAQVTNPPIDPLRESHVMSLEVHLREGLRLPSPVLAAGQLADLCAILGPVSRVDFSFPAQQGVPGGRCRVAQLASTPLSSSGRPGLLLLSDRAIGAERAALPALLATVIVWKRMVSEGLTDIPLVIEAAQVLDTHHVALLLAAGASAVVPYLAEQFAREVEPGGNQAMRTAIDAGLRKVLARMGISTLASYRNSQLFEILGLTAEFCAEFFEDAADFPGTKSLDDLLADYLQMHAIAFSKEFVELPDAGLYRFRKGAELHGNSPDVVRRLHAHVRKGAVDTFEAFEELAESAAPIVVRDLFDARAQAPVPVEEVVSEEEILRRFSTQAMSLGSLSPEAHRTLALAMNGLGARSNTGEGGEDPELYESDPAAANKIKQVASGRFGVTANYLVHAEEIEIKMAQGSKPGEGGQLPARKVTGYIARIRHATPGTPLISPPPHHDIYSIEDLAQLIHDLRAVNPHARIGVKLVAGAGVGIISAGVAKAGANVITISGHNGGTGSSPLTSIKNTGLPWEIGLLDAHNTLLAAGLRSRVTLRVDGGLKFARDVILAAALGADEFGFGTAALLSLGCVMARQCHLNTCPVGIATQDEMLRTRFTGKPEMVTAYFRALAGDVRRQLASLGAKSLEGLRGKIELRGDRGGLDAWSTPSTAPSAPVRDAGALPPFPDAGEWPPEAPALEGPAVLHNSDRSVGSALSGEILRRRERGDVDHTPLIREFRGTAGQSFGAFLADGITFCLEGEANDYIGKGLSGGTIAITAGAAASRRGDVLAGNTVLYGATFGQLYLAGRVGERFAVRNSGALAVVEGVGQHGCEYMTGGIALILGPVGPNFGSGMTGGLAYMLRAEVDDVLRRDFVSLVEITEDEDGWLRHVLKEHVRLTGSPRGSRLLARRAVLPTVRVQPLTLQGSIEMVWRPMLERLGEHQLAFPAAGSNGATASTVHQHA